MLDREYRERLERHYRLVKDAIAAPDHPSLRLVMRNEFLCVREWEEVSTLLRQEVKDSRSGDEMANSGPNDRCLCGSGKKYKRCCQAKDEEAARAASNASREPEPDRPADVPRGARRLDERKKRGQSPAQQIADFAQPLLAAAGNDLDACDRAFSLGMLFWNLALIHDEKPREEGLQLLLASVKTEADRASLRDLAGKMITRHERMFPELHR